MSFIRACLAEFIYLQIQADLKGVPSQRSLFHVLHCFSMHCKECGYCQGMGPIAATLLSYFDAPVSVVV